MKEIEILVEVRSTKEAAINALKQFTSHGIKHTLDIYFFDPLRQDLQPEINGRIRRSFRLRRKDVKCSIAYKIDHFKEDNDEWIYSDENEVSVSDFDTTLSILRHLGLQELVIVDNEKHVFTTPEYEIVLEDVKNLGLFLEVEQLAQVSDNGVISAKKKIQDFLSSLNIELGNELNSGKPELILKKHGKI
jgi:adenylate cyclase, class 2